MKLVKEKVLPIIMDALREDVGGGDITTAALFENDKNAMAHITANEGCVLCGIDVARWIFNSLDEKILLKPFCEDGEAVQKGKRILSLSGTVRSILSGERSALNFLGRLSGVATLTSQFVEKVKETKAEIFDTRKTMPGMRELEKYAVKVGGGQNHRMGLWDGVLIKDNHLDAIGVMCNMTRLRAIRDSLEKVRTRGHKNIEVEVNNLKEFEEALDAGADIIMLDNMKVEDINKAVKLRGKNQRPILEVSGGVDLENVKAFAKTGVERISVGSLTHSAPSIDFSLEICR